MRQCPTCRMITESRDECPICHTSLVYEPYVDADKEKITPNRYFWLYLAKKLWFSLACAIFCTVFLILAGKPSSPFFYAAITAATASLIASIFERRFSNALRHRYSEEYSAVKIFFLKYTLGLFAVIFALFL